KDLRKKIILRGDTVMFASTKEDSNACRSSRKLRCCRTFSGITSSADNRRQAAKYRLVGKDEERKRPTNPL
ncbi:hypothetical protein, partial [Parabacteroides johnsonii]